MTDAALSAPAVRRSFPLGRLLWPALLVVTIVLVNLPNGALPAWMTKYPAAWQIPTAAWISTFMRWLMEVASFGLFTVRDLFRAVAWVLDLPLAAAKAVLAEGIGWGRGADAVTIAPAIPWFSALIAGVAAAYKVGGARLAALIGAGLLYLAVFGQWAGAMVTLSSVLVSSALGAVGGLLIGLACVRWRWAERAVSPMLDLAQTMPVFAYLLPMLILFGFGPVSAMIATIVYAMPPMVRVTIIAIRAVPDEIRELGAMTGCTRRQLTWKMLVPSALPALMVGVNQVIMLSLNVVIIASMIGAGGLGFDVLSALRALKIGEGLEAGLAITVLAILLDRFAQALAVKTGRPPERDEQTARRKRSALQAAFMLAGALWILAAIVPDIARYPDALKLSTAPYWSDLVRWINVTFNATLDAIRTFAFLNLLAPAKRFALALPWAWVVALVVIAGLRLGGWRLGLGLGALALAIATTGLWQVAMLTVYLCGVAVVVACLIGVPVGVAAATRPRLWRAVETVIDLLQTLPSFVYLIPIVMLFRVGDFTALIAIVLYAVAPAIRYAAHGVARVPPTLIEAATMTGCTRRQILTRVRVPLALPEILLGINQTIMLALSMLVITALVGTRDLGQETYSALAKADVGKGLVAGLCVAFIAIIADRLVSAAAAKMKRRRGLGA
ncbi:ABC transporter permease [Chenggangzhangella methanolivorans]|uniref:ABC transporter permease subunit n=1 Tax=Chenggangzhangella methanolivorans TaxID=1437009 RepID=A0A9E6RA44_9HYPH|nr:ABC transporter permease subunit [Chenggangzhangella methanolivorans]QZO00372.1 ABC transporter permease subunit [Chenggangzhangella methanolivorans]